MAQSLAFLLVHVIFSTKDRRPFLRDEIRPELHAYLATVVRNLGCDCYRVGGVADHVHLAIRLPSTQPLADVIRKTKTTSSQWLKLRVPTFEWQRGYAAFSVGPHDREALLWYIDGQEEHHHKVSFQDEFRKLLKHYGVEFDERYVWD